MNSHAYPTAQRFLNGLIEEGVDVVFGLPGVHNIAFWSSQDPSPMRIVGVRHEQAAVYAADGYARKTGKLGVALTITGPGAANGVAAFGEAAAAGSPVLLIASEISTTLATPPNRGVVHQSADQAGMFAPLAKAIFRPRTAVAAMRDLADAIDTALSAPRGPVYLDVPMDVLNAAAPRFEVQRDRRDAHGATPDVGELLKLIEAAGSIVIWAGGGVVQAGAARPLAQLAARLDAPVVTTYAARGVLPPDHQLLVGLPPHESAVSDLIADADLLLAIGTDLDGMITRNWQMPMPKSLAEINVDASVLGRNFGADLRIRGDAAEVIAELLRRLPVGPLVAATAGAARVTAARDLGWKQVRADPRHELPLEFLATVGQHIADSADVILDMCIPGYWYAGYGRVGRPRQMQSPGWGTLGYSVPASIGAGVASDGRVLVICGDGGVMFALGEFATLAHEQLPVTVMIVDDRSYGMIKYDQLHLGFQPRGVDFESPNWELLAGAFGIPFESVSDCGAPLGEALSRAGAGRGPAVVVLHAAMTPPRTSSPRWFDYGV
jgi:thiamine pyrophosphate-dependent acetolactate synthase large subunit-like protein